MRADTGPKFIVHQSHKWEICNVTAEGGRYKIKVAKMK